MTTTLFLTVLPRYTHLYDAACQGSDYQAHGFHYTNLPTGSLTDSIVTAMPSSCDRVTVLHLTVHPSFTLPNTIIGQTSVCRNEVVTYSLPNAEGLSTFHWEVPEGVNIIAGQGTSEVSIYFTDNAPNPASLSLTGANGCGCGSLPLEVTLHPSYYLFFQDSLCTGNEYQGYGFDIARQDNTGWFTFRQNYTTAQGCDSIRTLQLIVTGTPTLTTLAQPAEICPGENVTIHAMGENAGFIQNAQAPPVAIGDILCTDNTIVKPSAWPMPGKTAYGIVFYVDDTGQHGWAVHLHDQSTSISWGGSGIDIAALPNYTHPRDASLDLDGYTNTQRIRAAGNATTYPAAYAVDFTNGWYLPAAGQLRLLYAEMVTINASLQTVGGTPFLMDANLYYWSSTERNSNSASDVQYNGNVGSFSKNRSYRVRSVRTF